jgi:hypothetical protein
VLAELEPQIAERGDHARFLLMYPTPQLGHIVPGHGVAHNAHGGPLGHTRNRAFTGSGLNRAFTGPGFAHSRQMGQYNVRLSSCLSG